MEDLFEKKAAKVVKNIKEEIENEKKIHKLIQEKISMIVENKRKKSFSERMGNIAAEFMGSWKFIVVFIVFAGISVHFIMKKSYNNNIFILLNLVLLCFVILQSSLIINNQNRKRNIDLRQLENQYKLNMKNEIVIEDIHYKLDELLEKQEELLERVIYLEGRKPDLSRRKYTLMKDIFEKKENE